MKTLVLTVVIGDEAEHLAAVTIPGKEAYARRIGADFRIIREKTGDWNPSWEKLQLYHFLGREYDRAIYLDNDCLVRPDCPDLFGIVPESAFGAFDEGRCFNRTGAMDRGFQDYGCPRLRKHWNECYFNSGVMVVSRRHRQLFAEPAVRHDNFIEQTFLNVGLVHHHLNVYDIGHEFNFMTSIVPLTGLPVEAGYIAHLAGTPAAAARGIAESILANWERAEPHYQFRKHIWLDVGGGLGDVIDAEPVLRYLKDKIFPDADVRVTSRWPRPLMGHADVPVEWGEDNPFEGSYSLKLMTTPPSTEAVWHTLTQVASQGTDWASISALNRQLPLKDREIQLTVFEQDEKEIEDIAGDWPLAKSVLIHPGRTWESRTFPQDWWQTVIDGIAKKAPVVLCGYNRELHGVLPVECPGNGLDLRDRTSTGGLFALVRSCPVLLSNDSGPVHAAGAFENAIVLIPSSRHPDLVLPLRYGSPYWNAVALYKNLTIDEVLGKPGLCRPQSATGAPAGAWTEYLPECEEVIATVLSLLGEDSKI